jgi:hypothetical protein
MGAAIEKLREIVALMQREHAAGRDPVRVLMRFNTAILPKAIDEIDALQARINHLSEED